MAEDTDHIDLGEARNYLDAALARIRKVDGAEIPRKAEPGQPSRSAALAEVSKELLFIGHLCKKAETAVLDEYYVARGEVDHIA